MSRVLNNGRIYIKIWLFIKFNNYKKRDVYKIIQKFYLKNLDKFHKSRPGPKRQKL